MDEPTRTNPHDPAQEEAIAAPGHSLLLMHASTLPPPFSSSVDTNTRTRSTPPLPLRSVLLPRWPPARFCGGLTESPRMALVFEGRRWGARFHIDDVRSDGLVLREYEASREALGRLSVCGIRMDG
jgi:hypothetical protein